MDLMKFMAGSGNFMRILLSSCISPLQSGSGLIGSILSVDFPFGIMCGGVLMVYPLRNFRQAEPPCSQPLPWREILEAA